MLAGFLPVGRLLEPILLQPQIELSAREAEALGGARPVPAAFAQDLGNRVALDRAEIGRRGAPWLRCRFEREVLHADEPSFTQNGGAFERVTELADVAGPVVPEQRLAGVASEAAGGRPKVLPRSCSNASLSGRTSAARSRNGGIAMSNTCSR
jgi:hypothetical protein